MKTETGSNNSNNNNNNNNNSAKMDFDMYPSISGKQQDPVREVVMKYIDYFLPEWVCDGCDYLCIGINRIKVLNINIFHCNT